MQNYSRIWVVVEVCIHWQSAFDAITHLFRKTSLPSDDAEELAGVLLEDQRADFVPDCNLFQVSHPAIWSKQRVIRAEQDFVFQKRIRVLHQLWRKIFWRPSRQVNVDVRLVEADRDRFVLPGKRWMRHDDRHVRKIHGHVVYRKRIPIFQSNSTSSRQAGPNPAV